MKAMKKQSQDWSLEDDWKKLCNIEAEWVSKGFKKEFIMLIKLETKIQKAMQKMLKWKEVLR